MKACAYCAESIQDAAILCRFCGRDQPVTAAGATQPDAPTSQHYKDEVKRRASLPIFARLKAGDYAGCPSCAKTVRVGVHEKCPQCGADFAAFTEPAGARSASHVKAMVALCVVVATVTAVWNAAVRTPATPPAAAPAASTASVPPVVAPKLPPPSTASPAARTDQTTVAPSDADCAKDLNCLARQNFGAATVGCTVAVEGLAKYSHEWTDGFLERKFSAHRWKDRQRGVVTFVGDEIRFQNGFGAWQNSTYECDFDTKSKAVVDARARPGRIAS